jgi:hypothetical protein
MSYSLTPISLIDTLSEDFQSHRKRKQSAGSVAPWNDKYN